MYSILLSKIEGLELLINKYKNIFDKDNKIAILPWAFPTELDSEKLMKEYFAKGERRYNKFLNQLTKFGIKEENIIVCDCYKQKCNELEKIIDDSDVLVLPGGNPEMLMSKILHETELLYKIKHYKGIIIGESAGCLLQLKRYFITEKNNFYNYFAFYDGIGVLDNPFLIDVHSSDDLEYMNLLQEVSNKNNKNVYAIFDDGAILYNRNTNEYELLGHVKEIKPNIF